MAFSLGTVTKSWRDFNLPYFQAELDQIAAELSERQECSELSRKRLIEQSKEFKKSAAAETKKQVAVLLRNFQNEIDDLTNRSKAAEAGFLSVYKKIIEVADPIPALEYAQSLQQSKKNNSCDLLQGDKEKSKQHDQYSLRRNASTESNQETIMKQLRDRVKELEDALDDQLAQRENDTHSQRKKTGVLSSPTNDCREEMLQRKVVEWEQKYRTLQTAYNTTQTALTKLRHEHSVNSCETEWALSELEVANKKISRLEKENCALQAQLTALTGSAQSSCNDNAEIEEAFQRLVNSDLEGTNSSDEKSEMAKNGSHNLARKSRSFNKLDFGCTIKQMPQLENSSGAASKILNLSTESALKDFNEEFEVVPKILGVRSTTSDDSDQDADSMSGTSDSNRSCGSKCPELFSPAQIAEKVSSECFKQGISVRSLSKDLNVINLRPFLEEPKTFNELSSYEFSVYLELIRWLKQQEAVKEETSRPKSAQETNKAIQRILECARKEMHGCEDQSGETTPTNADEISPKFGTLGDAITSEVALLPVPESVSSPKSPPFAQADLNVISQSLSSRNFLRKCPKVPGSRLTILAQMRRMALQPLNPEDVVKYTNCDTQLLADKVRRILENNAISQRVFGHYVLGMSQSSVSDLLLHPKPWGQTTGKGQESYIRMQKWVEDECGIERLKQLNSTFVMDVLSSIQQMQSTPSSTNGCSSGAKHKNGTSKVSSVVTANEDCLSSSNGSLDGSNATTGASNQQVNGASNQQQSTETFIKMEVPSFDSDEVESSHHLSNQSHAVTSPPAVNTSSCKTAAQVVGGKAKVKSEPPSLDTVTNGGTNVVALKPPNLARHETLVYPAPKVVSTANLPASPVPIITSANPKSMKMRRSLEVSEEMFQCYSMFGIDTFRLTEQTKILMSTYSIGQKLLGENILGLCQASVCDLLNKPRPWPGLHRRVKEAYIRLQIWVNNPNSFPLIDTYGENLMPVIGNENPPKSGLGSSTDASENIEAVPPAKKSKTEFTVPSVTKLDGNNPLSCSLNSEPSIQKLVSYVDGISGKSKNEDAVATSARCAANQTFLSANSNYISSSSSRSGGSGDGISDLLSDATDDINIESAAAEFVKNYLGSDDSEAASSSGDRLLTALGLCDENSYDDAELNHEESGTDSEYPQTVIVYPQSPLNVVPPSSQTNPTDITSSSRTLNNSMTSSCVKCEKPSPTASSCVPTSFSEEEQLTSLPNEAVTTVDPDLTSTDQDTEFAEDLIGSKFTSRFSKTNKAAKGPSTKSINSNSMKQSQLFNFSQSRRNNISSSNICSAIDSVISSSCSTSADDNNHDMEGVDLCVGSDSFLASKEERRVKIANLETKLQCQSQPWNEHVESMSLISKMQSNITADTNSDAWSDSPDSTN